MSHVDTDRLQRLKAIPLFAELPDASLTRVLEEAAEFDAPAGWVLVQPNTPGQGLFVIEEGTVAIEAHGKKRELGPGEFFGELSLLTEQETRAARVQAATAVKCLAISRQKFIPLLESEPKIAIAMLKTLAMRLLERGL